MPASARCSLSRMFQWRDANVTAHPTAEWTLPQFREALPGGHPYRFVIHDRDSIFSKELDKAVTDMGVRILRTPVRAPKANSVCERLMGTVRRECLDFLIPLGERLLFPLRYLDVILRQSARAGHLGNHCYVWLRK